MSKFLTSIAFLSFLGLFSSLMTSCRTSSSPKTPTDALAPLPKLSAKAQQKFAAGTRVMKRKRPKAKLQAIKLFQQATEIDENFWEAWHNLGVLFLSSGEPKRAISAFDKALAIHPEHTPALSGRAEAHRLRDEIPKAAADYQQMIASDPHVVSSYSRLAALWRESGDYGKALDILREGLRTVGANSLIYLELGLVYLAQERDELAELVLQKSITLNPQDPAAHNALALIAMHSGKDQLAFANFDRATEIAPHYIDARFNKASILLDAGDFARAKLELEAIARAAPNDLETKVALGVAQRGLGAYKAARDEWNAVVNTASPGAKSRLDALFNLAVLELDFMMDEKKALIALDLYLRNSGEKHSKYEEAKELRKEVEQ